MTTRAIGKQVVLLLLDRVFHLPPGTVHRFIQGLRIPRQVGDNIPGIGLGDQPLGLDNDPALDDLFLLLPRPGPITECPEHPLFLTRGLKLPFRPDTDAPLEPPPQSLDEVRPIRLQIVLGGTPQSTQWNAYIARYHYLGYQTLVGAQMRYTVHDRDGGLLALLGFSTAARKLAPRDRFIGWTPALREQNLPRVIDNARFLILPWIRIPNLASHILSVVCRQLTGDWTARYNTLPVLVETFVEIPRFNGGLYKASGWTHVGMTQGRGRYDRHTKRDQPKKAIWLRPLRKDWKRALNR